MKTLVQRSLLLFAAFMVVAVVILSGCSEAVVGHDAAPPGSSSFSATVAAHDGSNSTALAEASQAFHDASRLVHAREEAQRARRLISRW